VALKILVLVPPILCRSIYSRSSTHGTILLKFCYFLDLLVNERTPILLPSPFCNYCLCYLITNIFSNEFLRSLLRDAQTQNLFSLDSSSTDSISSVEDGWRELEDKLNKNNEVELRLSTPEDIHRYLEQSIDLESDLESETRQAVIPDSFNDDFDWMSEASNESGQLNLASSTDEALEADFRALSPEVRFSQTFLFFKI